MTAWASISSLSEGVGQLLDHLQRRVALAALQRADVRAVQPGPVGQRLLAESGLGSPALDDPPELLLQHSIQFMRLVISCRLIGRFAWSRSWRATPRSPGS
jgi:hypothetical protein